MSSVLLDVSVHVSDGALGLYAEGFEEPIDEPFEAAAEDA